MLLMDHGHAVRGIDNLNDAYDVRMKTWREIYRIRGEKELMEYHRNLGSEEPTFEE